MSPKKPKTLPQKIYHFLGSFGLAIGIMFFLFLLTFLGTLAQGEMGLFDAQKKYFNSAFLLHELPFGLVIPLPGVYLLLVILTINLIVGGILKMRRRWSLIGIYIIHGGMLFMMLSSFIEEQFKFEGQMTLAPGETSNEFSSYHDWELALIDTRDPNADTEYAISTEDFAKANEAEGRRFEIADVPFDVTVSGYARNAIPRPGGPVMSTAARPVIGGFYIQEQPIEPESERNLPAVYVTLTDRASGAESQHIVWGRSEHPLVYENGGAQYLIEMRHQRWEVPYSITLTEFLHEKHPNTGKPSNYESRVVKTEDGDKQNIAIRMNEPLRHRGYVFFQTSFIPDYPSPGITSTVLAVVNNPSDNYHLYGLIVITFGLLLHFVPKLGRYLKAERGQQA